MDWEIKLKGPPNHTFTCKQKVGEGDFEHKIVILILQIAILITIPGYSAAPEIRFGIVWEQPFVSSKTNGGVMYACACVWGAGEGW